MYVCDLPSLDGMACPYKADTMTRENRDYFSVGNTRHWKDTDQSSILTQLDGIDVEFELRDVCAAKSAGVCKHGEPISTLTFDSGSGTGVCNSTYNGRSYYNGGVGECDDNRCYENTTLCISDNAASQVDCPFHSVTDGNPRYRITLRLNNVATGCYISSVHVITYDPLDSKLDSDRCVQDVLGSKDLPDNTPDTSLAAKEVSVEPLPTAYNLFVRYDKEVYSLAAYIWCGSTYEKSDGTTRTPIRDKKVCTTAGADCEVDVDVH